MKSKTALQLHHYVGRFRHSLTCLPNLRISGTLSCGTNKSRHPGVNHPVTLTTSLGPFVGDRSPNRLPKAVRIALAGFTDSIGTMIAGCNESGVRFLTESLDPAGGLATVTFGGCHTRSSEAAWSSDTAAHVVDYDDDARDLTAQR